MTKCFNIGGQGLVEKGENAPFHTDIRQIFVFCWIDTDIHHISPVSHVHLLLM